MATTLPPDDDLAEALLAIPSNRDAFRIRHTDHFTIAYDTPPEILGRLIGRLEGTYDAIVRFCGGLGLEPQAPRGRLAVLFFDKHEEFARYRSERGAAGGSAAGFYDPQVDVAAFGNMLNSPELQDANAEIERITRLLGEMRGRSSRDARREREVLVRRMRVLRGQRDAIVERFNRFVLQHEAAHQMLFSMGIHPRGADNPVWLVEGLACQFEVPQAAANAAGTSGVARVNHMRLADLRDALGVEAHVSRITDQAFREVLSSGRLVPSRELISRPDLFAAGDGTVVYRYAQAWALVHYLARRHRDAFAAYLREIMQRRPGVRVPPEREVDLFSTHFGVPDEAFERGWADFTLKLRLDLREAGRSRAGD